MKKALFLVLLLLMFPLLGCTTEATNPHEDLCSILDGKDAWLCSKTYTSYFDTTVSLSFYVRDGETVDIEGLYTAVEGMMESLHQLFDKYHAYDGVVNVYSINHREESTITISQTLYDAISFGLEHEGEVTSDGVAMFNIALSPVLDVWHDARESSDCIQEGFYDVCPVPRTSIDGISFPVDPSQILLDSEQQTISFLEEGMSIDLGGYAKGYASEIITDYLDQQGITYLFNAGNSNVKAGGLNPRNEEGLFYIALTRPSIPITSTSYFAYLKVPGSMSVVTSGNYQRYFLGADDSLVYHHIIDPRTNYPGGEAMSVTLFFEDGALADLYSTAIYLLSVEEGLAVVNQKEGMEAIWYLSDGSVIESDHAAQYVSEYL